MNFPNWSNVRLIMARELRDQLRDRRTLFMIAVLPLLLYPLMGMLFTQMAQFMQKHPSQILIVGNEDLQSEDAFNEEKPSLVQYLHDRDLLAIDFRASSGAHVDEFKKTAADELSSRQYDAILYFPDEFVRSVTTTEADELETSVATSIDPSKPEIFYNAAKDRSRIAYERVAVALASWRSDLVQSSLAKLAVPKKAISPFEIAANDVAGPNVRRAALWSKILPFVVMVWALTGAFYPAVDLCAGEKERGTLETLLCSPAQRSDIVWGKLLTVMIFSITTALLNLLCMVFTASFILSRFRDLAEVAGPTMLGPPPITSLGWMLVALLPISALFSALALSLAAMARSSKEGQYYLMPLLMVTMPLMALPMLPSTELNLGTSIIPVTGVILLLRQLMEGEVQQAMLYALPVVFITGGCCLFAIRWAVDQFNNESVLFRESERFDLIQWFKYLFRERSDTPGVGTAILCGLLILLIRFFAGMMVPMPDSWSSFALVTAITLVAFVAAPAVVMAVALTTSPRRALLLNQTSPSAIFAAVLLAVSLHPLAIWLSTVVTEIYPINVEAFAPLQALLSAAPLYQLLLVLAVVPAICEELAFRGFILSGLRHLGTKWRAIVIASVFFGLTHGMLQQSIMAVVFGIVIGYLAVQTGSLLPCIAFHMVHNGLMVSLTQVGTEWLARYPQLRQLFQPVAEGQANGVEIPMYAWPVVAGGCVIALSLLGWFHMFPYQPSDEERLHDVLERQPMQPVSQ